MISILNGKGIDRLSRKILEKLMEKVLKSIWNRPHRTDFNTDRQKYTINQAFYFTTTFTSSPVLLVNYKQWNTLSLICTHKMKKALKLKVF